MRDDTDSETAVELRGLVVVRGGHRVLDDVGLTVRRGSVTGLLGPSGAGKTTLMRCVVGVQVVTAGTVEVLGRPAGHLQLRRLVGYVTQSPSVYGDLTAAENLRYFAAVVGASHARVDEVLRQVALDRLADRVVATLSGGERARVSLAAALLGEPDLLVLDEPTVGLDPVLRRDMWELFHHLADRGVTLLVSSHVMDEAARCTDLVLLRDGRLLAAGTLRQIEERTGSADLETSFLRLVEQTPSESEPAAGAPAAAQPTEGSSR